MADAWTTSLSPPEESKYQSWKSRYAPNDSGDDYDLRGAFKAGLTPDAKTGHWPDTYKKPNHPTFSDQSIYAKEGNPGHWVGEKFMPGSKDNQWEVESVEPNPGVPAPNWEVAGTEPLPVAAAPEEPLSRTSRMMKSVHDALISATPDEQAKGDYHVGLLSSLHDDLTDAGQNKDSITTGLKRLPGEVADIAASQTKQSMAGGKEFLIDGAIRQAKDNLDALKTGNTLYNKWLPASVKANAIKEAEDHLGDLERSQTRANIDYRLASGQGNSAIPESAGYVEKQLAQAGGSVVATAPLVVGGALTGAGVPALVALGGQAAAQRYGQLREAGVNEHDSTVSAALLGSLEGLTEAIPIGTLAKSTPIVKKAVEFLVTDVLGENISSLAQLADDYNRQLRDDVTADDIKQTIKDTTVQTAIGAGTQVGAFHLLETVINKANAKAASRQFDLERSASEMKLDIKKPDIQIEGPKATVAPDFEVGAEGTARRPGEEVVPPEPPAALPAPGSTGRFEGGPEGTRELTQNEVNAQNEALAERESLGTGNITRVPATEGTDVSRAPTDEQPAVQEEPLKGAAARRAIREQKVETLRDAITEIVKPEEVTLKNDDNGWTVYVRHKRSVSYTTEGLARQELQKIRQEIADHHNANPVVLGEQIQLPAEPTEAQATAGNYKKPPIRWNGMDIKVENIKDSTRSGIDSEGQRWSRKMASDYGYFKGTKSTDGEGVDVYMGPHRGVKTAYVIDQLKPDGLSHDEPKVVIGARSEEEAKKLYLKHYPKDWKGLGAITPMPVAGLKTWLASGETTKPLSWQPPKEKAAVRSTRAPEAKHDSLLEYVSKLRLHGAQTSGLNLAALESEGLDPADMKAAMGHGINRPFTKEGGSLDHAAEILTEAGYPVHGDKNKLIDLIYAELRGKKTYAAGKQLDALEEPMREPHGDLSDEENKALDARIERMMHLLDKETDDAPLLHRAFHGSKHKFNKFKLDDTTIGTGEGAQAYGHGLYFAENPVVANHYREMTTDQPEITHWKLGIHTLKRGDQWMDYSPRNSSDVEHARAKITENLLIDEAGARAAHATGKLKEHTLRMIDDLSKSSKDEWPEGVSAYKTLRDMVERHGTSMKIEEVAGAVYEVNIDDKAVKNFLDWDAPLSKQPTAVKELVRDVLKSNGHLRPNENGPRQLQSAWRSYLIENGGVFEGYKGESVYGMLMRESGLTDINKQQQKASQQLADIGVKGLKYLDGQSRPFSSKPSGTRNIVVFDDSIVNITHVDGTPVTQQEREAALAPKSHRGYGNPGHLPERVVRDEINRILKGFAVRPRMLVVGTLEQLPPDLLKALKYHAITEEMGASNGMYWKGSTYFIADQFARVSDIRQVVLHETVIHFGFDTLIRPETKTAILEGIAKSMPMEVMRRGIKEFGPVTRDAQGNHNGYNHADQKKRLLAAEEVLAYYGMKYLGKESIPARIKRFVERWFTAIRDALRRFFGRAQKFDTAFMKRLLQGLQTHMKSGEAITKYDHLSGNETFLDEGGPAAHRTAPTFYSALTHAIEDGKLNKAPAAQWASTIANLKGVKAEEIEWSGLTEWLAKQTGPVTKEQVVEYLRANEIQVTDVMKGAAEPGELSKTAELRAKADQAIVELTAMGYIPEFDPHDDGRLSEISDRNGRTMMYDGETGIWEDRDSGEFVELPADVKQKALQVGELTDQLANSPREDDVPTNATRYDQYTLPGGKHYRELLMTLSTNPSPAGLATRKIIFDKYQKKLDAVDNMEGMHGFDESMKLREERDREADAAYQLPKDNTYHSGHWNEKNIIAHVRFDERTDVDGKRLLHIAEVQSDWHQAGRKQGYGSNEPTKEEIEAKIKELKSEGYTVEDDVINPALPSADPRNRGPAIYRSGNFIQQRAISGSEQHAWEKFAKSQLGFRNKVPDAPFKTTWPELAMKRMIRFAAENGFDRLTWDTGETNADRYDLSKHVTAIRVTDATDENKVHVFVKHKTGYDGWTALNNGVSSVEKQKLPDIIGKELAQQALQRLENGESDVLFSGVDLKVGGEGMIGFYDKMLPATVGKYVKKWGGKVSANSIFAGQKSTNIDDGAGGVVTRATNDASAVVHSIDITPAMREAAMEGQPLFHRSTADVLHREVDKGSPEAKGYAKVANTVIDVWNKKIGNKYGALGNLPEAKQYLIERYKTLGHMKEVKDITRGIFDSLMKASHEDSKAVYDYLTTAGAQPNAIVDEKIRTTAMNVKDMIDVQGRNLVDAGLLPEEAYETYRDQYLPRLYLRHILKDEARAKSAGTGKKLSDMGYLKKRKDIPEEVRKVIFGEITDPAFLSAFGLSRTMRDLAIQNFLNTISRNESWTPQVMMIDWDGKRVSPFWLQAEAKQLRRQADHIKNIVVSKKARAIADHMDTLANGALQKLSAQSLEEFAQVPDSPRYGALRGVYVRKEIHEDLVGAYNWVDTSSMGGLDKFFADTFGQGGRISKATKLWKMSKVTLNMPSHFRNMYGNTMMLHMSGVNGAMLPVRLYQAINSLATKDHAYQIGMKYGLSEATFANNELLRIRDEWLMLQKSKQPTANLAFTMIKKVGQSIGDIYQFEEQLFKLAKLHDGLAKGQNEADAMIEAHKWLFDYSLVPKWVRYMRNAPFGIPFLSYQYFVLPRLAETAIRRPWKYLPYMMAIYAMVEALMSTYGADDDDVKKLKKSYPEWMQDKGSLMLWPYQDEQGRWQVLDTGSITPWGNYADTMTELMHGEFGDAARSVGVLGGPISDVISAFKTNVDPFTKKPIVNPGDPAWQQTYSAINYAYSMAAPSFLTDKGAIAKIIDAKTGKVDPKSGEPALNESQAWLRLFGVNVYAIDPEATREKNLRFMAFEIKETQTRMGQLLRDKNLTDVDKEEIRRVYTQELKRRQEALRTYQRDSEVPPKLRRGTSDLTSRVAPLIDGRSKADAVRALKDAGHPALAALIGDMPAKPRPLVAQALSVGAS